MSPQKQGMRGSTKRGEGRRRGQEGGCGVLDSRRLLQNTFEPKDINFAEECQARHPGKHWADLHIKEQTLIIADVLRADHYLLNPNSKGMRCWDCIIVAALCFIGLVTPYEVVFMTNTSIGLFVINRILDFIFLLDMVLQLFLKVEIQRKGNYGSMTLRDPKLLRWRYLKGWFVVDLVSVLPYDVGVLLLQGPPDSLQTVKILRCVRVLRLLKLARMLRSSRILHRWQNYLSITFAEQKLIMQLVCLVLASHWMACLWGAVGLFFGKELCHDGALVEGPVPTEQVSWITNLFLESKRSPDDPCTSFHIYLASLHWSVMTITSIGYGDIYPVRDTEYIICIVCMLLGGVLWAYVIGCTCSVLSKVNPVEDYFQSSTDLLNRIMHELGIPSETRHKYREYLREAKIFDAKDMFRDVTSRFSPGLRQELTLHISERSLRQVFYFRDFPRELVMALSERLSSRFFACREPLTNIAHSLCIIDHGSVAHGGQILVPGSSFQHDMIITNDGLHVERRAVSLTYALILVLSRSSLDEALEGFPVCKREIRKQAAKITLGRIVRVCAHLARRTPMTLTEAFGLLDNNPEALRLIWRSCARENNGLADTLSSVDNETSEATLHSSPDSMLLMRFPKRRSKADAEPGARWSRHPGLKMPGKIPEEELAKQQPLRDTKAAAHKNIERKLGLMAKELQTLSMELANLQDTFTI